MDKKRKKVYFIHCARYNHIAPIVSMGLWGLADYLDRNEYEVKIINTKSEQLVTGDFQISNYLDEDVFAIGVSVQWFPGLKEALDLAMEVKGLKHQIKVFFGGYTSSFFAVKLMETYKCIDFIIKGDGEIPTLKLLDGLKDKIEDFSTVPNLVWREGGRVVNNPIDYVSTREDIKHLNYANFSKYLYNYHLCKDVEPFNIEYSKVSNFHVVDFEPRKTFYLLTGKGCIVDCAFCGGGKEAQKAINNRCGCMFLHHDQIIDTVMGAMEHGYNSFYVCFDPYPKNPRYIGWLNKLAEKKLDIDLVFGFWALPEEKLLQHFKKVTNRLIFELSPESISERVRKKVRGFHFSNEEFYSIVEKLNEERIYTWIYFSYPLPYETIEEIHETRQAFWEINTNYEHYIEAFYLKQSTDPGSQIFSDPGKFEMELHTNDLEEHMQKGMSSIGNILIHRNKDLVVERESLYKRILLDNTLKKIFNYSIKYFVKSFNSIPEFIRFVDKFYEEIDKDAISSDDMLVSELMLFASKEYTNQEIQFERYLLEIISFMEAQIKAYQRKDTPLIRTNAETNDLNSNSEVCLNDSIVLIDLQYNLFNAYKTLIMDKRYIDIRETKPAYYILDNQKGNLNFVEINESLYDLLHCVRKNQQMTIKDVADEVACSYADNEEEYRYIHKDLENALLQLVKQDVLLIQDYE